MEQKEQFLFLREDGITLGVRRTEETNASTEVLDRCSSLGKGLHGVRWEADSLACSRKFIWAERRHEAKKRN